MKLIRLLKRITAIITLYTLQTNSCVSRCRARGDGPVALAELVTCCVVLSRLLYSVRDTARTTFSCTKMHGLDSESWRVVTHQVEFGLYGDWSYHLAAGSEKGTITCRRLCGVLIGRWPPMRSWLATSLSIWTLVASRGAPTHVAWQRLGCSQHRCFVSRLRLNDKSSAFSILVFISLSG